MGPTAQGRPRDVWRRTHLRPKFGRSCDMQGDKPTRTSASECVAHGELWATCSRESQASRTLARPGPWQSATSTAHRGCRQLGHRLKELNGVTRPKGGGRANGRLSDTPPLRPRPRSAGLIPLAGANTVCKAELQSPGGAQLIATSSGTSASPGIAVQSIHGAAGQYRQQRAPAVAIHGRGANERCIRRWVRHSAGGSTRPQRTRV